MLSFNVRMAIDVFLPQQTIRDSHGISLPTHPIRLSPQQTEVLHNLQHGQAVDPRTHVIDHDAYSFRETFEMAYRRRLHDIEPSKKYKAEQQRFPCYRCRDKRDELTGNLVDDNELRIV